MIYILYIFIDFNVKETYICKFHIFFYLLDSKNIINDSESASTPLADRVEIKSRAFKQCIKPPPWNKGQT